MANQLVGHFLRKSGQLVFMRTRFLQLRMGRLRHKIQFMTTAFKLLDDPRLRGMLKRQLFRVGYDLGSWESDPHLMTHLDVPVQPFGRAPVLLLRLEQGPYGDWEWGCLLNHDASAELGRFAFDTTKPYSKSCYEVWIEQIVEAVRCAAATQLG
jgi:hypothetical protein